MLSILSKEIVLFSDVFGTVCGMNFFSLLLFFIPMPSICQIDRHERSSRHSVKIHPGKWSFLFATYSKEKQWYPKKTIVLQLVTYIFFLLTIAFSAVCVFIPCEYAVMACMFWLLFVFAFVGCVNSMARSKPFG